MGHIDTRIQNGNNRTLGINNRLVPQLFYTILIQIPLLIGKWVTSKAASNIGISNIDLIVRLCVFYLVEFFQFVSELLCLWGVSLICF